MHEPRRRTRRRAGRAIGWVIAAAVSASLAGGAVKAAEVEDAQKLFRTGKYAEAVEMADASLKKSQWGVGWWLTKIRGEMVTGQYAEALRTYEAGLKRYDESISLRLLGYDVLRANNRPEEAQQALAEIRQAAERAPWRYGDAASRVALGRALLISGADARQVLELFYDRAKKDSPESAEPFLASGELALSKHDFALAAEAFGEAVKRDKEDPEAYFGLARAFENDAEQATGALAKALELNPKHVEGLLFQADNLIDREDYAGAEAILKEVLSINPRHPKAWAFRAVMAHVAGDKAAEASHRAAALESWKSNPEVDHVIGQKLAAKYRFAEGAAYQRKALAFAPDYLPAKVQLCQDLLRLGKDDEGWALAAEASKADPYDVVTFNLSTLHDHLSKYRTLKSEHFVVRMDEREAQVYGPRVLRLLAKAREKLFAKYGVELNEPVTVEIFAQQQDFAIRTFGLPGGAGFLGVCFGPLITMNSPATRGGHPSNWEAVLWHEFCHTATLTKTRNKMPRWLSEGISVYEERQERPAWGQAMTPQYRELILSGGATPVSKLSGAFLKPPSPMHLQFAYYESSMVVEYVMERFGAQALQGVLTDLGNDVAINPALAKHTEAIEKLDENFAKWLKEKAEKLGSDKVDWERPKLALDADSAAMNLWNQQHPNNFWGLLGEGRALLSEKKWQEAKKPLEKAIALYPGYGEAGGPYLLMAQAHRELGEAKAEREMLEKHAALDADAIEARVRLMEMLAKEGDWKGVREHAEQVLAVNPLVPAPHTYLAKAAETAGDRQLGIEAHRTLLLLDPLDRAEQHYRLAKLLAEEKQLAEARQQVVRSLEEAPRYRAAHRLLLEIAGKMEKPAAATQPATAPAPRPAAASEIRDEKRLVVKEPQP